MISLNATDLAALVKDWRGTLPASRAAQLLGIPARTLEGIEQGRGFRYPVLIILAIQAVKPPAPLTPPQS